MLLDLGSVREITETENVFQRPILGSMAYMAPEQFVSSYHIDRASDLYISRRDSVSGDQQNAPDRASTFDA